MAPIWWAWSDSNFHTRLDTLEFTEYVEKCRVWANEFLGLNIPLPGEVAA